MGGFAVAANFPVGMVPGPVAGRFQQAQVVPPGSDGSTHAGCSIPVHWNAGPTGWNAH